MTRFSSIIACVIVLVAFGTFQAANAKGQKCPPPPYSFSETEVKTLVLSSVDSSRATLAGADAVNRGKTMVRYCDGARVSGRAGIADLRPGDIVTARTVKSTSRDRIAVELEVNLITIVARIGKTGESSFSITTLNDQTLAPIQKLYPLYLGSPPSVALTAPSTAFTAGGHEIQFNSIKSGELAKVYGYKAPASRDIYAFRVEILSAH